MQQFKLLRRSKTTLWPKFSFCTFSISANINAVQKTKPTKESPFFHFYNPSNALYSQNSGTKKAFTRAFLHIYAEKSPLVKRLLLTQHPQNEEGRTTIYFVLSYLSCILSLNSFRRNSAQSAFAFSRSWAKQGPKRGLTVGGIGGYKKEGGAVGMLSTFSRVKSFQARRRRSRSSTTKGKKAIPSERNSLV